MLTFKHNADRLRYRSVFVTGMDGGVQEFTTGAYYHIGLFNALSENLTGKSAVVTSWHRDDHTAHNGGNAVDFRIHHYGPLETRRLERAAIRHGIPIIQVKKGTPSHHWHCGPVATLAYERE
jgi:hypothetical protein